MLVVILGTDLAYEAMTRLDEHQWGKIQTLSKLTFWVPVECALFKEIIGNAAKLSLISRVMFLLILKYIFLFYKIFMLYSIN